MERLLVDFGYMYCECNVVLVVLEQVYYEVLMCLVVVVELCDDDIGIYIVCLGYLVEVLVWYFGVLVVCVQMLCLVVFMYDIGKLGVFDDVLKKFGQLILDECVCMQDYFCMGVDIFGCFSILVFVLVVEVVLYYYECWDGKGYLQGLQGEVILLLGCIVVVVDYFDVLMMDCCYWFVFVDDCVFVMLVDQLGGVFDLVIVLIFLVYVVELIVLCEWVNMIQFGFGLQQFEVLLFQVWLVGVIDLLCVFDEVWV